MRIAIDCRVLEKKITGIGRYLLEILQGLSQIDDKNQYFLISQSKIELNFNNKFVFIIIPHNFLHAKLFSPIWLNLILPKYLKRFNIDLFFTPNHLIPFKMFIKNMKTIIVVHDLAHLQKYKYHSFIYRNYQNLILRYSINNCDSIITVSNYSKKDILKYFKNLSTKIDVIYENCNKNIKRLEVNENDENRLNQKYYLPSNFILYVGVIEYRKNIECILKICDLLKSKGITNKIVLIGRPGYGFNNLKKEIVKRKESVIYLNYVEEEELIKIYNLAKVFIFPSFFEGFGLPPLEAMKVGIPVVVSNSSSLPEVVGDKIPTFAPNNAKEFADEIEKLIQDRIYYNRMKNIAIERGNYFSLEKNVKELLKVFNKFENKN